MYKDNELYVCRPWTYLERKDKKILLLWSDIPTWMVVDEDLFLLLKMFDGETTMDMIGDCIAVKLSQSSVKVKQLMAQILPILVNAKVVYKLDDRIPSSDWSDDRISGVIIHPTNRCNLNCKMCCNKNNRVLKKDEISIEKIKQFLYEVLEFANDKPAISIIGGEPLLAPDKVLEITKYAKEIGYEVVGTSTNGTLITREFAKKAKKVGLEFQVSIDGATEEENDYMRGAGVFKKIIEGIKILKEEGLHVETSFTCHEGNYKSLEKYFELVYNLGVDLVRFGLMKRMGGGLNGELEVVPIEKVLESGYNLFKQHPEYRKLFGKDYLSVFSNACGLKVKSNYCGTGTITVLLNPDGAIYPCAGHALPEFKAGNICKSSFSEIWQHSPVLKRIRSTYPVDIINEKCSKCMVRYMCLGGCRAEAYLCTHKMNSPAVDCERIKKSIIKTIWLLSMTPELGKGEQYIFD